MLMQAKIVADWKDAMKNKDPKKDALNMIIAELKNRAIKDNVMGQDGRQVADEVALEVLQKMSKQRKEAIDSYTAAKRDDLVDKEKFELSVIENYLPKPLSDEELKALVSSAILESQASSKKDMGKVMGLAISKSQGRADGKRIQALVQELLP